MSNQDELSPQPDTPERDHEDTHERQYEESGLYPREGKSFRLIALLACLIGIITFLALSSIVLDRILI